MSAFVAKHGQAEERRGKRPRPCLARCPPACYTIFLHLARTHVQIQKGGKRTLSCGDICYRLACMLAIWSTPVSPLRNVLLRNYTRVLCCGDSWSALSLCSSLVILKMFIPYVLNGVPSLNLVAENFLFWGLFQVVPGHRLALSSDLSTEPNLFFSRSILLRILKSSLCKLWCENTLDEVAWWSHWIVLSSQRPLRLKSHFPGKNTKVIAV